MTVNLPSLNQALTSLYSNTERAQKEAASAYLEAFQKSAEAWQVTHEVLESDVATTEAKLFAAQTIKTKVLQLHQMMLRLQMRYDFHQLSAGSLANFRDSLVALIRRYSPGPRPILIALNVALATLALQMPQWTTVLEDMSSSFTDSPETWNALLTFMSILPEEINESRKMSLTEEQLQQRIEALLTGNGEHVLALLIAYLSKSATPETTNPLILSCLTSWLREIPIAKVVNTPLIDMAFQALSSDALFDSATDLLCAVFKETNEVNDPEMVKLIQVLLPRLMSLRPRIEASKDDSDAFRNYTRLFAEAGEAWLILIVRSPPQFRPLVEAIAETAAIDEDLEVVKFTFNFWYDLKQALTTPKYDDARRYFSDIYLNLVDIMIEHLHYPSGSDLSDDNLFLGDSEAEDKFRDFRHEMGDVLKDCCNVAGGSICLAKAFTKVQGLLEAGKSTAVSWQQIEAPLFSMRAMAREIDPNEEDVLPHIMDTLLSLPEHPKIRYAATLVLGRYTEWTARHPDYLLPQLNYITSGFSAGNKDVLSAAAQALKHFCRDCSKLLIDHIQSLYGFYAQVLPSLDFDSQVETTDGIAHVVLAQPRSTLTEALRSFISPIIERISQRCTTFDSDELTHRKLADDIELLTVFAFTVNPYIDGKEAHPCVPVYAEIWPVLAKALDNYGQIQFISERVCSWMRTILNKTRRAALPLLPSFAEKLAACFAQRKFGCYLWVSGACVREFASTEDNDSTTISAVWSFVDSQCIEMFKLLSSSEPNLISDIVEDFFRLMMDALLGNPEIFLSSPMLETVVQASMASLSIQQVDALTTILRFLRDLLSWGLPTPPTSGQKCSPQASSALRLLLSKYGAEIVRSTFLGQIYKFPADCIADASGVLLTIFEIQPESCIDAIRMALNTLPAGSISSSECNTFINNLTISYQKAELRRARSQLQDLTNLYRRRTASNRSLELTGEK